MAYYVNFKQDEAQKELQYHLTMLDALDTDVSTIKQRYSVNLSKRSYFRMLLEVELEKYGYTVLGNGYFALAATKKDSGVVLKLGFRREDSGAAYAAFCRDNQGMAGIPTIYDIARFVNFYVIVMPQYFTYSSEYNVSVGCVRDSEVVFMGSNDTPYYYALCGISERREDYGISKSSPFFKYYETASYIREYFKGLAEFDLHEGNIMLDNCGNLVITDPISYTITRTNNKHPRFLDYSLD